VVNIGNTVGAAGAAIRILKAMKRGRLDQARTA
jgi:NCAIR mutase (PurE)-related protein